jgi:hypothetical protein
MKALRDLEAFAFTVNDNDKHLPKSRDRCFDVGIWGGCGATCPVFVDGECEEPQEITKKEVIDEQGKDAELIFQKYECFQQQG